MSERLVEVVPEEGLHARPASKFVETANEYDAEIKLGQSGADELVSAGSMIAVTSLGIACGDEVRIVADGEDDEAALDVLETVLTTPEAEFADT